MSERTKGEWRVEMNALGDEFNIFDIFAGETCVIGEEGLYTPANKDAEANAHFIVKAVNCHAKLVEALEGLMQEIDYAVEDGTLPRNAVDSNASHKEAKEAIAKTKGGKE